MINRNEFVNFLSKVLIPLGEAAKNECWMWQGATKGNGYGNFQGTPAQRKSYELFVGEVPDGHDVCHMCDVRGCVNPNHLFTGTREQNQADMAAKGRGRKPGKRIPQSVRQEVLTRREGGMSYQAIADSLCMSRQSAMIICKEVANG